MGNLRSLKPLFGDDILLTDFDPESDQINTMYKYYIEDFVNHPILIGKKQVITFQEKSKIKIFSNYPETFVHLITREIKLTRQRFYECNRANRIHWIKPILISFPDKNILYYKWKDEKEVIKDHFWLFEKDFMVVLKEYRANFLIITAFCLDNDQKIKYYERFKAYKENHGGI